MPPPPQATSQIPQNSDKPMLLAEGPRGHLGTSKLCVTFAIEKQMHPCPGRRMLVCGGRELSLSLDAAVPPLSSL